MNGPFQNVKTLGGEHRVLLPISPDQHGSDFCGIHVALDAMILKDMTTEVMTTETSARILTCHI